MRFETKIWHPNISSETGEISLDALKNEWTPALTIRTMLISLQGLMSAPEPGNPLDTKVARQYLSNKKLFEQTARDWTKIYANDPDIIREEKIKKLVGMGFAIKAVKEILEICKWNEEAAINCLLGE